MKRKLFISLFAIAVIVCLVVGAIKIFGGDGIRKLEFKNNIGPEIVYYESDSSFNLNSSVLVVRYTDGKTKEVEITNEMLSYFNNKKGEHTCFVTFENKILKFTYTVLSGTRPADN